jgi:hypothetical protein
MKLDGECPICLEDMFNSTDSATKRRWNKYLKQWIVAKSIDHLFDSDTASVIASYY